MIHIMKKLIYRKTVQKSFICFVILGAAFYFRIGLASKFNAPASLSFTQSASAEEMPGQGKHKRVDINKASMDELVLLPGIGPKIAQKILSHRETHGDFKDLNSLLQIKGIGQKKLEKLSPLILIRSAGE